ncbi:MAG TPA: CAP domain-containing protein, partial [Phototrophicaceae bacterium]|nr:CAP domain-containing protein [Phototrophicaceae bacterium]
MPSMKTLRTLFATTLLLMLTLTLSTASVQAQDAVSDLLGRINGLRSSLGLPGYALNGALSAAAQNQAQWMAETGSVTHTRPDGSTPTSRAAAAGYPSSFVSENIYAGSIARVDDAWTFWINSPIHYRGLTNPGYTEVGIGAASAAWGNAFVLVFGSQSNPYVAAPGGGNNSSKGSGNDAAAAPPSFIVGYDAVGNIMHEIQPGQTMGDIALIYGYTWADIPHLLEVNGLTEEDVRKLPEGGVFLVPPHSGTYTPSPLPPGVTLTASDEPPSATPGEATLTPTIDMTQVVQMIQNQTDTDTPPTQSAVVQPRIGTAAGVPEDLSETVNVVVSPPIDLPIQDQIIPTNTPDPQSVINPTEDISVTKVAQLGTTIPASSQVVLVRQDQNTPLILIAIVVQSLVILA